jgi:MFS family permease
MECAPKYKFGLFGSLYFAAVVIGSFIFAPLADKIGRKPVTLAGVLLAAMA